MRAIQFFTAEYLEECKKLTPEQIIQFLEDFRKQYATSEIDTSLVQKTDQKLIVTKNAKFPLHKK